jgi:hypothetical protein
MPVRYTPLTLFEVLMGRHKKTDHQTDRPERSEAVTSYELGETSGRGQELESNFEDIPVSSVVYMGRGSFRMEVTPEPVRTGIVQPIQSTLGVVTAPLHAKGRGDSDGNAPLGARRPRSLFGSQIDVPLLAAPMGVPGFHAAPAVSLSRATLATLGGAVLLCGIVVGTAARHLWSRPAPTPVVATMPVASVPDVAVAPAQVAAPSASAAAPTAEPQVQVVAVPTPVTIRPRARTVVKPALAPARKAVEPAPAPKQWVDPWAS